MNPEHIIDEEVIMPNADIENVYDDCLAWIKGLKKTPWYGRRQDIDNVKEEKPHRIEANHYKIRGIRPPFTFDIEIKKIILSLHKKNDDVVIHLLIDSPNPNILINPKLTASYWGYLVESFWKFIGTTPTIDALRKVYPKANMKYMISEQSLWVLLSTITIMLFALQAYGNKFENSGVYVILIIMFITFLVELDSYIKKRRRLQLLYPKNEKN